MHSLASPLAAPYAGGVAGALPGLGGFALGQAAPALRGLTNPGLALATVLLVSNLNEEVCFIIPIVICKSNQLCVCLLLLLLDEILRKKKKCHIV